MLEHQTEAGRKNLYGKWAGMTDRFSCSSMPSANSWSRRLPNPEGSDLRPECQEKISDRFSAFDHEQANQRHSAVEQGVGNIETRRRAVRTLSANPASPVATGKVNTLSR